MKKKLIIGAVLLFLSLIHPVLYYYYEGEHKIINEHTYLSRNNNNNETQRWEKFDQYRIIYHAYKNIRLGRYDSFSTIDDNNVLNSFPLYKYYSPALFYLLGLLMFVFKDVVITFAFALWVFSGLYAAGIYLLAKKFSKDAATACLAAAVAITAPYMGTNTLSRYSLSEEVAGFMQPMLIFLFLELLEQGKQQLLSHKKALIDYLFTASLFTSLGTLFVLTHNITTLYTPFIFGIPVLIYVFLEIKPSLKSILLALVPFVFIFLSALYYILPSMQTQTHLLISDTFAGLLFPYLDLNSFGSLFSFLPTMSPISTTPALWLQIGWPTLVLGALCFRSRTIVIWGIFFFIIIMILSPTIWMVLPQPFLAIQFPYRLLAYIPLLFVFGAKKLSWKAIVPVGIITVIFAVIFFQRPAAPGSFYAYDFDMFPSVNAWNYYYKGDNQNIQIEGISAPPEEVVHPVKDAKDPLSSVFTVEPMKGHMQAVTYRFSVTDAADKKLPYTVVTDTTFKDGSTVNRLLRYGVGPDGSFIGSYCLRNVKKQVLSFGVPPTFKGPLKITRFADTSQMFLASGSSFFPVTCSYDERENGRIFVFHPKKEEVEKTILIPVFYSDLNQVLDGSGNQMSAQSLEDAEQRSYTAVKNPKNNTEIRIKLFGNDNWNAISYPVIELTLAVTFVILAVKIGTIIKPPKPHAKTHL